MNPWKRAGPLIGASLAGAAVVIALGLAFANPPQCPPNVSQQEIRDTGCNIGANIGLGLIFMFALAILIVGGIVAVSFYSQDSRPTPPPPTIPTPPG